MKYCIASFLVGMVLLSNSTLSDQSKNETIKQSPLDVVYQRYQSGYYSNTRLRAVEQVTQQDVRIRQLLFSRMSLLEAKTQIHADTDLHADIERMLAYTENELEILGVKPTEFANRIVRGNDK